MSNENADKKPTPSNNQTKVSIGGSDKNPSTPKKTPPKVSIGGKKPTPNSSKDNSIEIGTGIIPKDRDVKNPNKKLEAVRQRDEERRGGERDIRIPDYKIIGKIPEKAKDIPEVKKQRDAILNGSKVKFKEAVLNNEKLRTYFKPDDPNSLTEKELPSPVEFYYDYINTDKHKTGVPQELHKMINDVDLAISSWLRADGQKELRKKYKLEKYFTEEARTEGAKKQKKFKEREEITSKNIKGKSPAEIKKLIQLKGADGLTQKEKEDVLAFLSGNNKESKDYFNIHNLHPTQRDALIGEIESIKPSDRIRLDEKMRKEKLTDDESRKLQGFLQEKNPKKKPLSYQERVLRKLEESLRKQKKLGKKEKIRLPNILQSRSAKIPKDVPTKVSAADKKPESFVRDIIEERERLKKSIKANIALNNFGLNIIKSNIKKYGYGDASQGNGQIEPHTDLFIPDMTVIRTKKIKKLI
ncbi:MAG: hypothetical protein FJZ43_04790 [Candidatus Staskawiczbacteria bacterium]|nr:hypothetical protein [Candidatus Staskawiczbacteria bacterium]